MIINVVCKTATTKIYNLNQENTFKKSNFRSDVKSSNPNSSIVEQIKQIQETVSNMKSLFGAIN
jgi:DNA polymerase/3'-5' exonuclease PolX